MMSGVSISGPMDSISSASRADTAGGYSVSGGQPSETAVAQALHESAAIARTIGGLTKLGILDLDGAGQTSCALAPAARREGGQQGQHARHGLGQAADERGDRREPDHALSRCACSLARGR